MVNSLNLDKMPPKLSVIVIAYNNELYVEEALESLYEQTFDDMEVVVVNDCSTDRTGELIDQFIQGKPKFKAIHLPENSGGCSIPRNTGIANTTGEYVMFLDGDDWYTSEACEKMVAGIERTQSDFVAGQVIRTNNYEIWYHRQIYSEERTNISIREFSMLLFDSLSVNKIYKRSFLDKHKLRFPEGIHYEDIYFTGQAYFLAESVSIIPEPIYYWRVVEDADVKSITNRRFDFDNFKNRIIAHRLFDKFLRENGDSLYQKHKNNKFLRHDLKLYTNDYLLFDEDYKKQFHKMIFDYLQETMDVYEFIRLPERERIMYYLLYIGDREAFEDYISYINHLPTKTNRVYNVGEFYYFRASVLNSKNEKFLKIDQPVINYSINNIELDKKVFSFNAQVNMNSVADSEITTFWRLRNRQTGDVIYNEETKEEVIKFNLNQMVSGNYYLSLYVRHMGNLHRILVKNTMVADFINLETKENGLSKSIFINKNNSFSLKVRPLKKLDQLRWMYDKRKFTKSIRKPNVFLKVLERIARKVIPKLPLRSNWVLFESNMGKQYSDNPKYIYEEMYQSNKNHKFIWSFEDPSSIELPGPAIKVKRNSLKHFYYLNRSKYWVDNQGIAHIAQKKKEQVYLQTWHGTPLKRMGYDQKKLPSTAELSRLKIQTKAWDYFISPNKYSTSTFKKAFRYGGEIIETGYPRNDILINRNREVEQKVKDYLGISSEKRTILFAPTFRDYDPNSFQKVIKDIQSISREIDDNSIILVRLHYLLSNKIVQSDLPKNVINVSTYEDVQELYLLSDILITDYSSTMFDYALLKRPIILYCYDLDEYIARRGMYFDFLEKSPGPICQTISDVIYYLNHSKDLVKFNKSLEEFVNEFGSIEDGNATRRVIDQVFK